MKSDWLPTMPLHVAIWSQIVFDSDLSWEDQGRAIRLLANAWSAGELERKAWASDEAWRAASRMWPEMLAARNENIAKRDKLSESGKRGNKIRWRSRGDSPPDSPPESPPESPPDSPGDRIQSRSISSKQKQEHNQKQEPEPKERAPRGWKKAPRDFALSDDLVDYGVEKGLTEDEVSEEYEAFMRCDFKTAHTDARDTFMNWLLREAKSRKKVAPIRRSTTAAQTTHDAAARALNKLGAGL